MRFSLVAVRLVALLVVSSWAALAEDGPLDPAFHKAHDQFAILEQQLEALRARAAADLVGKDADRYPYDPRYVPIEKGQIDAGIDPAVNVARASRRELIRRRQAWDRVETTLDAFHNATYNQIGAAVGAHWKAHINIALAYINSWSAEMGKLGLKQNEEERRVTAELEAAHGWGSPQYNAGLIKLRERQSEERRKLFVSVGTRYTKLRDDMVAVRAQWSTELWKWVDFANRRIAQEGDVHAYGKYNLGVAVQNSFGYGRKDGNASEIDYLCNFPGSPDRIITGYGDPWLDPPPFPELQIQEGCPGCFRINSIAKVPVEDYRSEDEPVDKLRATSLRVTLMDPESPLQEATPLQYFRVVAESAGYPTTDATDRLTASVRGSSGQAVEVVLTPWSTDPHPLYVSDPVLVATPGADPNGEMIEVAACSGEELRASIDRFSTSLKITVGSDLLNPAPCVVPEDPPRFRLEARSSTRLTFDPDDRGDDYTFLTGYGSLPRDTRGANMPQPPAVRFLDETGKPLEGEQIVWMLPEREETFVTYTDAEGVTQLDFRVAARGTFAASVDGIPTGEPIPDGKYRLVAMPSDPTFAALLEDGPPEFEIDFVSPTTMDFIDRTGQRLDALVSQQRFGVRVWLGRKDMKRAGSQKLIKVRLDPTIRLRDPLYLEAKHINGRAFESGFLYSARTEASIGSALERLFGNGNLLVEPNEIVTLSYGNASVGAVVYPNGVRLGEARTRAGLKFWRDTLDHHLATAQDGGERLRLLRLRGFMDRGLQWLDDAKLPMHYRVPVAAEYLNLLEVPEEALGLYNAPVNFSRFESAVHKFVCNFEQVRVEGALQQAHDATIVTVGERVQRVGGGFVDFVVGLPDMLFVTPFLGGYTAITGWTADGETATTFERVVGGFDAVTAAFGTSQMVRGAATRVVSAGKAAVGVSQRAIIGEGLSSGVLSFSRAFGTQTGTALARQAPEYVVDGLVEAVGREILMESPETSESISPAQIQGPAIILLNGRKRVRPKVTARERLNRSVQYRDRYHGERMNDLNDTANAINRTESEIKELNGQLAGATPAGQAEIKRQIASRQKHLETLDRRLPVIAKRAQRHADVLERSHRAMNELRDISLSDAYVRQMVEQDPSWRPYGSQSVAGTRAQLHYERQVAKELETEGFVPGRRTPINTAIPSPLDEGYLAGTGGGRPRKAVQNPHPDHINYDTLEMADSKYYKPFKMLKSQKKLPPVKLRDGRIIERVVDEKMLCAAEIADTVEKARAVQMELIVKRRIAELDAAGEMASLKRIRREAAAELKKRAPKITIYTPDSVPDDIRAMIRRLSGGGEIAFKEIAPDVLGWLKT